jgi:UDP-glucuronate decarboxylase
MHLLSSDIDEIVDHLPESFWHRFSGKKVLLTGGRGFLGRYFTEVFVRANAKVLHPLRLAPVSVVAMDSLIASGPAGRAVGEQPGVTFVQHDVTQKLPDIGRVDYILHAAGIASPAWYQKHPIETYRVAAFGTANVLELAERHAGCRLLFFSSSEIYGNPDPKFVPTAETYNGYVSCLGPRSCYDESKRMGEMMVKVHHQQRGVEGCIIRPFNFYGPGMQPTDYRVLPNFAARWVDGKPLQVYGDGRQTRTFCYVTDGIRGALRVLAFGHGGEAYNIGNPDPEISVRDLALMVGQVTGAKVELEESDYPSTYPADEPMRRCPDIRKAQAHLDYAPLVPLREGLGRFFGWAGTAFREIKSAAE